MKNRLLLLMLLVATGVQAQITLRTDYLPQMECKSYCDIQLQNSTITGATCLNFDGSVTFTVTGANSPFTVQGQTGTTFTINSLKWGGHQIKVTDAIGCSRDFLFKVPALNNIDLTNISTSCTGSTYNINYTIIGTAPPFTVVSINDVLDASGNKIGEAHQIRDVNYCGRVFMFDGVCQ